MNQILNISATNQSEYFIVSVCISGYAWGLYDGDGFWAKTNAKDGSVSFPIWPGLEYAELCAQGSWTGYKPRKIYLDALIDVMIPDMIEKNESFSLFFTADHKGIHAPANELRDALNEELEND